MNGKPTFQINLLVGRGGFAGIPTVTAEPVKIRLNRMGLSIADYVAID